jgi:hypothetical protein
MARETARHDPAAALPASRAFVVHFGAPRGRGVRFAGRAEHLASGRFTHFASLRGLLSFFGEVLEASREPSRRTELPPTRSRT